MSIVLKSKPPAGKVPDIEQAMALHRQGRLREAALIYAAILAAEPARSDALHFAGLASFQMGRLPEALRLMAAALRADPGSADIHSNYGLALDSSHQRQQALASFDTAIALMPDHVQALSNRALTLAALGRTSEALDSWGRALAANPDHAEALYGRGNVLYELRRYDEALADYERFLALRPGNPDLFNNYGSALSEIGRLEDAIVSYERALALDPKLPEVVINKGHVLADMHQFDAALACYAQAAKLEGRRAEAAFAASLVRLRRGQFDAGWREYEWRWKQAHWAGRARDFAAPLWLGQDSPAGKTVLLHSEQDSEIRCSSSATLGCWPRARGCCSSQPPLSSLLSGSEGIAQTFARGEPLPRFDLHCPLMSLPLACGTALDTIPAEVPYVRAPADRVAHWRARLGESQSLRVGIVWAGSAVHKNNHNRSIAFERFQPLLSAPGIEFVSLQGELGPADAASLARHPNVVALGAELRDFADTAAVVSLMDRGVGRYRLVHCRCAGRGLGAGAFSPDFRWLLGRGTNPVPDHACSGSRDSVIGRACSRA